MKNQTRNHQSNQPVRDQATAILWSLKREPLVHQAWLHHMAVIPPTFHLKWEARMADLVKPTKPRDIAAWLEQYCLIPASSTLLTRDKFWKCSSISTVKTTVHTDPSRQKWSSSKRSSNQRNLKALALHFGVDGKTEVLENKEILITTSSFPQTQFQNDQCLLRFQIVPAWCGRPGQFDLLSEWERRLLLSNFSRVGWTRPNIDVELRYRCKQRSDPSYKTTTRLASSYSRLKDSI